MPVWFRIDLLGDFRLCDAMGESAPAPGRHAQALLALLATARDNMMTREQLAGLLWEDRQGEQARRSLRQCLFTVRQALAPYGEEILTSDGDRVRLDTTAVDVDIALFEAAAGKADIDALERACALYRGELLAGLNVRSDAFNEWLATQRRRLEARFARVLSQLVALRLETGDRAGAIEAGERLVALDPLDEAACRLLMQALAAAGQRSEALRQFNLLTERLTDELAAEPEAETRALADHLRHDGSTGASDVAVQDTLVTSPQAAGSDKRTGTDTAKPKRAARSRKLVEYLAVAAATLLIAVSVDWFWLDGSVSRFAARSVANLLALDFDRPSLAVLPFDDLDGTSASATIAQALSEDIGAALSTVSSMRVYGGVSVFGGGAVRPGNNTVARRLGVRYTLGGTVQSKDDTVRVWIHLYDHATNEELWARRFSEPLEDVFDLQDYITLEVITSLQVELSEGEQERISLLHGSRNLDAWLLAGQALQLLRRLVKVDNERARALYRRAIEHDASYAAAWEGLGWSHLLATWFGWSDDPRGSLVEAKRLADKALALNRDRGRAHSLLGSIALTGGDCEAAIEAGRTAVRINPQDSEAKALLAYFFTLCSNVERSIELSQNAIELSPYPPAWYHWNLGRAYRLAGRYGEAIEQLTIGLDEHQQTPIPRIELLLALQQNGDKAAARRVASEIRNLAPGFRVEAWSYHSIDPDAKRRDQEAALLRDANLP